MCTLDIPLQTVSLLAHHYSLQQQHSGTTEENLLPQNLLSTPVLREIDTSTGDGVSQCVSLTVQRSQLEGLLSEFITDIKQTIHSAVLDYRNHAASNNDDCGESGYESLTIDEVVLVGGSSLLPCVRSAIKEALVEEGVTSFGGLDVGDDKGKVETENVREFCSSVNPHECVAHGLAVKGALMMGIREGKLKELLMIDSVPYAVGILSYQPPESSTSQESKDKVMEDCWVFDPILERGMRLPCTGRKTFALDTSSLQARQVSIDIYEETFEGNSVDSEIKFISNCDLPIGHLRVCNKSDSECHSEKQSQSPTVDVVFHMTENGEIKYSVEDSEEKMNRETGSTRTEDADPNGGGTLILGFYLFCLVVLYVIVKVVIVGNTELLQDLQERGYGEDELAALSVGGDGSDGSDGSDGGGYVDVSEDVVSSINSDVINGEFEF